MVIGDIWNCGSGCVGVRGGCGVRRRGNGGEGGYSLGLCNFTPTHLKNRFVNKFLSEIKASSPGPLTACTSTFI